MTRQVEIPKLEKTPNAHSDSVETHPAYAQIGASRVSGGVYLYGSDFQHQHFVTIHISRSELHRGLSNDWPHARDELIEVALSEAQWAAFVSTMNSGEGVQCTLQHVGRKDIPQLPAPIARHDQFTDEAKKTMADGLAKLRQLRDVIVNSKLPAKAKEEQLRILDKGVQELAENLPFVAEQFAEHTEGVIEQAKGEITAYISGAIQRAGIKALQAEGPPIALPPGKTER
jgi:hypothetical protein